MSRGILRRFHLDAMDLHSIVRQPRPLCKFVLSGTLWTTSHVSVIRLGPLNPKSHRPTCQARLGNLSDRTSKSPGLSCI